MKASYRAAAPVVAGVLTLITLPAFAQSTTATPDTAASPEVLSPATVSSPAVLSPEAAAARPTPAERNSQVAQAAGTRSGTTTTGGRSSDQYYMPYDTRFWATGGIAAGRSDWGPGCFGPLGCDRRDIGYKAWVGGKFQDMFGLELGYVNMGHARLGTGGSAKAHGVNLSVLGGLPVGQGASLFAKLGTTYGWTEVDSVAPYPGGKEHGFGVSYGVGATLPVSRNLDVRVDWDRHRMDFATGKDNVNLYTVGLQFKFQ